MSTDFRSALRDELLRASRRQQVRRRRRRRVALLSGVAVLVAVVGGLAVGLGRPAPVAAGVDIEVRDGAISVRLTDLESRPGVIEQALREAGIDAAIEAEPAGPSEVGRFIWHTASGAAPPPVLRFIDERHGSFAGFIVPVGWAGQLELSVGRPAARGESYARPSNAFAESEPLACSNLLGRTVRAAAASMAASALAVRVQPYTPSGPEGGPLSLDAAASSRGDWRIVEGQAFSPNDIVLLVTADGSALPGRPEVVEAQC